MNHVPASKIRKFNSVWSRMILTEPCLSASTSPSPQITAVIRFLNSLPEKHYTYLSKCYYAY